MLFIPRGFAHGFLVVSETATFAYKVDNVYSPQEEVTISYNDETIGINWPIDDIEIKLSEKDKHGIRFIDAEYF
jgi:dTDP-4-dehydrorhamnose 3,5-epimerase